MSKSGLGVPVATLLLSLAIGNIVHVSGAGGYFEANTDRSCICKINCPIEEVLQEVLQLEESVQTLSQSQTKQRLLLERKLDSLEERLIEKITQLEENQMEQSGSLEGKLESLLEPRCPENFIYVSDSEICIKLYKNRLSWPAADNFCRDLGEGYRLAVLDTDTKYQFVQDLLRSDLRRCGWLDQCWVGAKQEDGGSRWLWSTGEEVAQGWGPGQPNDYEGNEDCVTLAFAEDWTTWMFNDAPCTPRASKGVLDQYQYICEYQLN